MLHFADGGQLVGHFVDGAAEGDARLTTGGEDSYMGPVHRSKPHGVGVWIGADGSRFEGTFAAGERDGPGQLVYADGGRIKGSWARGELDGHADVSLTNGSRYVGQFVRGKREGRGKARGPDGATYDGEWRNGQRWGEGEWNAGASSASTSSDAPTHYKGGWVADKRVGYGSTTFASGASYVGHIDDEQRFHGEGRYASAPGRRTTSTTRASGSRVCATAEEEHAGGRRQRVRWAMGPRCA